MARQVGNALFYQRQHTRQGGVVLRDVSDESLILLRLERRQDRR